MSVPNLYFSDQTLARSFLLSLFLLFLSVIYTAIDRWLAIGLSKIKTANSSHLPKVSVLLCARNEEGQISKCIDAILQQNYPQNQWEFLIANDRSTDNTLKILQTYAQKHAHIKVFSMPENKDGTSAKKKALSTLIQQAKGEILLTTDADCIVSPNWIASMATQFDSTTDMVVGFSSFHKSQSNTFIALQALEFLSHFIVSSAAINNGLPINSSGNNLAYRKSTFEKLKGFEGVSHITSGDDDLLLHKFARNNPDSIRFNTAQDSFVLTQAQETLRGLWEQRKRWASKTIYYNGKVVALLSAVFLFYSFTLIGLFSFLWNNDSLFYTAVFAFFLKTALDYYVVAKGAKIFHQQHLIKYFIPTALVHIPLIVGAVVFGIFGRFEWKGRASSRSSN